MGPLSFFAQTRIFIVTGKGGTGKTTVSGVLANLACRQGLRALVVELGTPGSRREPEVAHLARLFGREHALDYEQVVLRSGPGAGAVHARALRPDAALVEYLHLHGMRRLSRRLVSSGALDVVATAVPGMPDILVLGKLKQMERAAVAGSPDAPDVIVLDAPAAGHAVRFLQSPQGLLEAAGGGPVRSQSDEIVQMLSDPARCQVLLVTTPEETPVSETVETAGLLEDRTSVKLCGVVVNARFPSLRLEMAMTQAVIGSLARAAGVALAELQEASLLSAAAVRLQAQASQAAQVARLREELPLPQLELPFCFDAELGPDQLVVLTDALEASVQRWAPVGA